MFRIFPSQKKKKNLKRKKENKERIYLSRFALRASYNRGFLGFYKAFNLVALISYFLFSSTLVQ